MSKPIPASAAACLPFGVLAADHFSTIEQAGDRNNADHDQEDVGTNRAVTFQSGSLQILAQRQSGHGQQAERRQASSTGSIVWQAQIGETDWAAANQGGAVGSLIEQTQMGHVEVSTKH